MNKYAVYYKDVYFDCPKRRVVMASSRNKAIDKCKRENSDCYIVDACELIKD